MKKICLCVLLCLVMFAISLPSRAQDETADWQKAVASGKDALTKGNVRLATFYFANALGKEPGNMEIINTYRETILTVIDGSKDDETRFSYLTALELFLENQIAAVPSDKVEQLAAWLDEVQNQKSAIDEKTEQPEETTPEEDENQVAFEELKGLLHTQIDAIKATLTLGEKHFDVASYQLQECEHLMRSIIALQPKLNEELKKKVAEEYEDLQKMSDEVVNAKSEVVWNKYMEGYKDFVVEINKFKNYTPEPAKNEKNEPVDGVAQKRIRLIQNEIRNLQEILPKLAPKHLGKENGDNTFTPNTAAATLHHLQEIYQEAQEVQQKLYNQWALKMCKEGMDKAYKAQSWFGPNWDKKRRAIASFLIQYLGPIDERFLTSQVHRCYQEFTSQYLSESQLNPIKDNDSWLDQGTIGYTLNAIFNTPKVQLFQF
ncbi:MAG: hypothetical protein Q4A17_06975 [Thermoguttaceae bacterium]|nr:hypothetical protein [Thermoguttaceae bacterium]